MQFLFRDRRPVAGFISGGIRAGKDSGARGWVRQVTKANEGGRRKCQANQS